MEVEMETNAGTSESANEQGSNENFKRPDFSFSITQKKPAIAKAAPSIIESSDISDEEKSQPKLEDEKKSVRFAQANPAMKSSLSYSEPSWSGCPEDRYFLEVLKNGSIVEEININAKAFWVFGRLEQCDSRLEHPSVSRFHAVLQYRAEESPGYPCGYYIYDLNSTHGTFANKQQIAPRVYSRVRVGHVLRFGFSTRYFILQGPDSDMETESNQTVTELKRRADEHRRKLEALEKKETQEDEAVPEKDQGIDWGFGDEDESKEDSDSSEEDEGKGGGESINFHSAEEREQLYIDDPMKTLKGFFDREGIELEYDFVEKSSNINHQWTCRIELPIETPDGRPLVAEASVSGPKKEAQKAAALQACKMLDAEGVLRQNNQESKRKKLKNWAANDYYDSDEDEFLDRTGDLEQKREARKRRLGVENSKPNTYETLVERLEVAEQQIKESSAELDRLLALIHHHVGQSTSEDQKDTLDAFMAHLEDESGQPIDKLRINQLRLKLQALGTEKERLQKLIKIAKPVQLPHLKKPAGDASAADSKRKQMLLGALKQQRMVKSQPPKVEIPAPVPESVVIPSVETPEASVPKIENESKPTEEPAKSERKPLPKIFSEDEVAPRRLPMLDDTDRKPGLNMVKRKSIQAEEDDEPHKKFAMPAKTYEEYDDNDDAYSTWLPPSGQSGDGKTSLNAKFGY